MGDRIKVNLPVKDREVKNFLQGLVGHIERDKKEINWTPPQEISAGDKKGGGLGAYSTENNTVTVNVPEVMQNVNALFSKNAPGRKEFVAGFLAAIIAHELSHAKHLRQDFTTKVHSGWKSGDQQMEVFNAVPSIPIKVRKDIVTTPLSFFPLGYHQNLAGTPLGERMERRADYLAGEYPGHYTDKSLDEKPAGFPKTKLVGVLMAGEFITHIGMLHELVGYAEKLAKKVEKNTIEDSFIRQMAELSRNLEVVTQGKDTPPGQLSRQDKKCLDKVLEPVYTAFGKRAREANLGQKASSINLASVDPVLDSEELELSFS